MKTNEINEEFLIPESFNRLNDVYFKYVLANPENKHITIAFLNSVLNHLKIDNEEPVIIEDVEFIDRETIPEAEKAKGARFDVLARSVDGRIFHIEVQNVKEKFFMQRSFFYAASDYNAQIERGKKYDELEPIIFIGIMNFRLFGSYDRPEDWYTLHRFMNVATHEYTLREVEFHMIELPLLKRYIEKGGIKPKDGLEEFLCYFGRIGGETLVNEIAEDNSVVEDLRALERLFRRDPMYIRNFLINERDKIDLKNNIMYEREEAREEGLAEGLSQGLEEGLAQGLEQGLEQGRTQGLEQGLEQGRTQGLQEGLEQGLKEGLTQGLERGLTQGLKEGRAAGRAETVRILRAQKILTDEQIAEALNMPIELIKTL